MRELVSGIDALYLSGHASLSDRLLSDLAALRVEAESADEAQPFRHRDDWLPGVHEPLVSVEEFDQAHRGRVPGRKRGKDVMSGRVICGLCSRRMSIDSNGQGQIHYRCKHRGSGCKLPARSNRGLLDAAGLGITLLYDAELRAAIRQHLDARRTSGVSRCRRAPKGNGGRTMLLAELLAGVTIHPDRLEVELHGAPPLNVAFSAVGLRDSENRGVGGPT